MYFLKSNDKQITPKMYAVGVPHDTDGLHLTVNQNTRRALEDPKNQASRTVRAHSIEAKIIENSQVITNNNQDCKLATTNLQTAPSTSKEPKSKLVLTSQAQKQKSSSMATKIGETVYFCQI